MENQQMGMPPEATAPAMGPDQMAIFDQMRQEISPQEFTSEMLAGGAQIDPQAVAEFTRALEGLNMPPEVLDALNDMVDALLAEPEKYAQMRQEFIKEGVPEDFLPEQFDPEFFAALNMAVDQMVGEPSGVQAFAQGGIAELKPIAKAIASYGRNGDTMLAHITPAEARMLRRRGGSGTINPDTGLPEFFLKKVFKAVGKVFKAVGKAVSSVVKGVVGAVKKFASSTVGRIITTVALGFFLGPAAASMLGVSSAAGVAAVSGFVGSAGATLAGGGSLKDALKAGAVGGLTAGAGAGIMGGSGAFASGSYTGPTTIGGQVDVFKNAVGLGGPSNLAPVVDAPASVPGTFGQDPTAAVGPGAAPVPSAGAYDPATATRAVDFGYTPGGTPATAGAAPTLPGAAGTAPAPGGVPTVSDSLSRIGQGLGMGEGPANFADIKQGVGDLFAPSGATPAQINAQASELVRQNPGMTFTEALKQANAAMTPGLLRTYGPAVAAGLGVMSLTGGFTPKQPEPSQMAEDFKARDARFPTLTDKPSDYYVQGLPGVTYDDKGAITGGQSWSPTATMDDVRVASPSQQSGIGSLAPSGGQGTMYNVPGNAIGGQSRQVYQPYNTASMYPSLYGRPSPYSYPYRYAEGGEVQDDEVPGFAFGGSLFGGMGRRLQEQAAAQAAAQAARIAAEKAAVIQAHADAGQAASARAAAMTLNNVQVASPSRSAPVNPRFTPPSERYAPRFADAFAPGQAMQNAQRRATSGIATLAKGGYPRRTGQISGPGTETSDSIPAMLSDGEFVMTAKAVKGAGNGSRRAGAKKMYDLMHQLERNASRG